MDEDSKHINPWGLTGDPEEDARRKRAAPNRIERIRKEYKFGQTDLLEGLGSGVRPVKTNNKKFKDDQRAIMIALALDLHEHIPEQMAQKFGFTSRREADENPPTNYVDNGKPPF